MTELVQRSTDFVRSALLEHLGFESNVEARALTQQPRGQQWRVIRVSGDMRCGFLEFGEGNDLRRSNLGGHGGSLRSRVRRRFVRRTGVKRGTGVTQDANPDSARASQAVNHTV